MGLFDPFSIKPFYQTTLTTMLYTAFVLTAILGCVNGAKDGPQKPQLRRQESRLEEKAFHKNLTTLVPNKEDPILVENLDVKKFQTAIDRAMTNGICSARSKAVVESIINACAFHDGAHVSFQDMVEVITRSNNNLLLMRAVLK